MSIVTNCVLSANYMDHATRDSLQAGGWEDIGHYAGGTKVFEADCYGKAFNHTSIETITNEVMQLVAGSVEGCVLVIHEEFDSGDEVNVWRLSTLSGEPVLQEIVRSE